MRQLGDLPITRVLCLKTFILNQVNCQEQRQFRRCTRQRDTLEAYNVDNCYKSKDNSYRQPARGNCIRSLASSTFTFDCSRLSSTKPCRERDWWEWIYYPWTRTTDENPTRSHQTTIFQSIRLHCTIMCTAIPISRSLPLTVNVRLWRRGFLSIKSGYRDQLYNESTPGGDAIRRSRSRSSEYHICEFSHQYLQCYECWWSTYRPRKPTTTLNWMTIGCTADAAPGT